MRLKTTLKSTLKKKLYFHTSEQGISLLGAIVSLAVIGAIGVGLISINEKSFKASSRMKIDIDKLAIREAITDAVSCAETLTLGTCTPNTILPVIRKLPNNSLETVVSNITPTRFGRGGQIAVRAICNNDGDGLLLQATLLKPGKLITSANSADFKADPLTGLKHTWTSYQANILKHRCALCSPNCRSGVPDLENCVNISIPFRPDRRQVNSHHIKCPTLHPYFSGIWTSQEDVGRDSDLIRKLECCAKK